MGTREARRWQRNQMANAPDGISFTMQTHDEYERELTRFYPIKVTITAYEIDRDAMHWLVDNAWLYPDDTPTGGIIGGDGGFGWTPAINFEHDGAPESFGSVYVTPWPETVRPITYGHDWERVARAVVSTFAT